MFEQDSISRKAVIRVFYVIFAILGITVMLVAWAKVNPIATVTVLSIMVLPILGTWAFLNRRNRRLGKTG
jgi:Flp pilus assembly protein TadB